MGGLAPAQVKWPRVDAHSVAGCRSITHLIVVGSARVGRGGRKLRPQLLEIEWLQVCCRSEPICTVPRAAFASREGWRHCAFSNFTISDGKIPNGRHSIGYAKFAGTCAGAILPRSGLRMGSPVLTAALTRTRDAPHWAAHDESPPDGSSGLCHGACRQMFCANAQFYRQCR